MKYIKKILLNSFFLFSSFLIYCAERETPLIKAITNFEFKTVQDIISRTVDFPNQLFPLHYAVETANRHSKELEKISVLQKIITYLIDNGAKKNLLDYRGQTPLDIALDFNNQGLGLFLINLYTTENETILHRLVFIANDYQKANKLNILKSLQEIAFYILNKHPEMILSINEKQKTAFDYALEENNILLIKMFNSFFESEKTKSSSEKELGPRVDRTLKPKKPLASKEISPSQYSVYEFASSFSPIPKKETASSLYDSLDERIKTDDTDYLVPGQPVNFSLKKDKKSSDYEVNW